MWLSFLAVCAVLAMVLPVAAQSTGTMKGVVNDDKGQPVDGAKVVIEMNGGTGRRFETKTNKKGEYFQIGLNPGSYKVTAEKDKLASAPVTLTVRQRDGGSQSHARRRERRREQGSRREDRGADEGFRGRRHAQ
jgi:hypothetical protein